jgi:hypothetical protein
MHVPVWMDAGSEVGGASKTRSVGGAGCPCPPTPWKSRCLRPSIAARRCSERYDKRRGDRDAEARRRSLGGDADARLWEIAENLHRAELTGAERREHIAEWAKLTGEKPQLPHDGAIESKRADGRGSKGGLRAAERELGIGHSEAQRAVKIASVTPEATEPSRPSEPKAQALRASRIEIAALPARNA